MFGIDEYIDCRNDCTVYASVCTVYPSLGFLGFVLGIWAFGKVLLLGFRLNALGNWNGANFAPVSLLYFKSHVDRIKIPGGAPSRS